MLVGSGLAALLDAWRRLRYSLGRLTPALNLVGAAHIYSVIGWGHANLEMATVPGIRASATGKSPRWSNSRCTPHTHQDWKADNRSGGEAGRPMAKLPLARREGGGSCSPWGNPDLRRPR